jgi:protein-S-isoprenylcysteine O-methyltransferase Ste14
VTESTTAARTLISGLWIGFAVIWLVLARFSKKRSKGAPWSFWGLRLIVLATVVAWLVLRQLAPQLVGSLGIVPWLPGLPVQWLGVGLCLAGFALAFWARVHIGRNWGVPMSLRENHELVTSGPYRYVRHPIYSGIMLAMIGTAFATDLAWLALFVIYFVFFLFAARSEEKTMQRQFPEAYSAYRRRTKMLIPFVL